MELIQAVHSDDPVAGVVEAHEQIDDGGLARPRGAHDGHGLAGSGLQIQVVKHGLLRGIAEADVLRLHMAPAVGQLPGPVEVLGLLRLVQQLEDPLRGGQSGEDLVDDIGYFGDGAGELPAVEHEAGDLGQAHDPVQIEHRAPQADGGQAEVGDHADGGAHGHAHPGGVPEGLRGGPVDAAEAPGHLLLLSVGQDGLLAREHLLGKAVHLAVGAAAFGIERPRPLAHGAGKEDRGGDREEHAQHQRRRDDAHHREAARHGHGAGEDMDHVAGEGSADHVDVVGDAADDVARLVAVKVAHRQGHQLVKDVLPQVPGHPLAHPGHADVHQEAQYVGAHVGQQHQKGVAQHGLHVHPAHAQTEAGLGLPDGLAREAGPQQVAEIAQKSAQKQGQHSGPIAHQIHQNAPQRRLRVPRLGLYAPAVPGTRHGLHLLSTQNKQPNTT